jgi:DNA repair exonuclease SbcCD ATPase subunit
MDLKLENFRGVTNGALKISDKITRIAGPVGSGKTSTIQTLQALVAGETVPVDGLKKKDGHLLIKKGTKSAKASLTWAEGTTEVKWNASGIKQTGPEFKCSKYAAGLVLPVNIPTKEFTELLGILPTKEEFDKAMEDMEALELPTEAIWEATQKNGWDGALSNAQNKRKALWGEWTKLAGEPYGSDKGRNFSPPHWVDSPLTDLEVSQKTAQRLYEHSIKAQALDEKAKQDMKDLAAHSATGDGSAAKKVDELNQQLTAISAEIAQTEKLFQEVPKILNSQKAYECWHCGKLGVLDNEKMIQPPDATSEEDATAIRLKLQELEGLSKQLKAKQYELNLSIRDARAYSDKCEDAQRKLAQVSLDTEPPAMTPAQAKEELELCGKRIAAHHAKIELAEIDMAIRANDVICSILSPEGLRKQVLSAKLAAFNDLLSVICDIAEWPLVSVDEDLQIRFLKPGEAESLPYVLLSEGQKYAANVVLQVAFTKLDGSQILIFDEAQSLDANLLPGFVAILGNIPIPAVVGFMYSRKNLVPDMGDLGVTYWCEAENITLLEIAVV